MNSLPDEIIVLTLESMTPFYRYQYIVVNKHIKSLVEIVNKNRHPVDGDISMIYYCKQHARLIVQNGDLNIIKRVKKYNTQRFINLSIELNKGKVFDMLKESYRLNNESLYLAYVNGNKYIIDEVERLVGDREMFGTRMRIQYYLGNTEVFPDYSYRELAIRAWCKSGNVEMIRKHVRSTTISYETLHSAIESKNIEIFRLILNEYSSFDTEDFEYVVSNGTEDMINNVLDSGKNMCPINLINHYKDRSRDFMLHIIDILDDDEDSDDGDGRISIASRHIDNADEVEYLLHKELGIKCGCPRINVKDIETLLIMAIEKNYIDTIKVLLRIEVGNLNEALLHAVRYTNVEIITILIEVGANNFDEALQLFNRMKSSKIDEIILQYL